MDKKPKRHATHVSIDKLELLQLKIDLCQAQIQNLELMMQIQRTRVAELLTQLQEEQSKRT